MTLKKFADIVGSDHFYDALDILEAYSKDNSFVPPRKPLAVIKPNNTDVIKEVIELANQTLTNIVSTSSSFRSFTVIQFPRVPV